MSAKNSNEEEYFYKKDRELIEKTKEKEAQKQMAEEMHSHLGKCPTCGDGLERRLAFGKHFTHCHGCKTMQIKTETLKELLEDKNLKKVLFELSQEEADQVA